MNPDLVVADIRMPPTNTTEGLDAARVIREERPDTAILVLSAHVDIEDAVELLASENRIGSGIGLRPQAQRPTGRAQRSGAGRCSR